MQPNKQVFLKGVIKDTDEEPKEETREARPSRELSSGSSVLESWGAPSSQHADVFTDPEGSKP